MQWNAFDIESTSFEGTHAFKLFIAKCYKLNPAARDILSRRQELIQLAYSSELGWKVVAEYEANPITSDSEDEKRIHKTEARDARQLKPDKTARKRS